MAEVAPAENWKAIQTKPQMEYTNLRKTLQMEAAVTGANIRSFPYVSYQLTGTPFVLGTLLRFNKDGDANVDAATLAAMTTAATKGSPIYILP